MECVLSDSIQILREGDFSQLRAAPECAIANASHARMDGHLRKLGAHLEGFFPDFGHTFGNDDLGYV